MLQISYYEHKIRIFYGEELVDTLRYHCGRFNFCFIDFSYFRLSVVYFFLAAFFFQKDLVNPKFLRIFARNYKSMENPRYHTHLMSGVIETITDDGKYYSIGLKDGVNFGLAKKHVSRRKIVPQAGDIITLHTYGGSSIRGIDLNEKKLYYLTEAQLEADRVKWLAKNQKRKETAFKKGVKRLDKAYDNLPDAFKKRFDRFRANDANFRVDSESYEMFCCEQAVAIAKGCGTPDDVKTFARKEWAEQVKIVPELNDGHSHNTFGSAINLAYWYLTDPTKI